MKNESVSTTKSTFGKTNSKNIKTIKKNLEKKNK